MPTRSSRYGLPKRERILKSRRFKWVLRRGRRHYTPHFTLVFRESGEGSSLGLTVSRKVGNAVERNHVKRRLRECYRLHKHLIRSPLWLVVIARPGAAALTYHDVCHEFVPFLRTPPRPGASRGRSFDGRVRGSGRAEGGGRGGGGSDGKTVSPSRS